MSKFNKHCISYQEHKTFFQMFFKPSDFLTKTAQTLLKSARKNNVGIRTATFYQIYREIRSELKNEDMDNTAEILKVEKNP